MSKRSVYLVAVAVVIGVTLKAGATCTQHQDVTTVCAGGACWTNIWYYESCTAGGGSGGDDGGSGGPGPGPGGGSGNFYDQDGDGYIDEWRGVVGTDDPCANNFDTNDRLGTDYGGANDVRHDHGGVDIQANRGDGVFPFRSGTVESVGWAGDCGYRVKVDHGDGTWSTYCHMVGDSSAHLQAGTYVHAGRTQVGQVNSTGASSGDHLHLVWGGTGIGAEDRWEYFSCTDSQPTSNELNAGGC